MTFLKLSKSTSHRDVLIVDTHFLRTLLFPGTAIAGNGYGVGLYARKNTVRCVLMFVLAAAFSSPVPVALNPLLVSCFVRLVGRNCFY